MEFKEYGEYDPNCLQFADELQPLDFAKLSPLRRLNYLLGVVKENKPDILDTYIANLNKKYSASIKKNYVEESKLDLDGEIGELLHLKENLDLAIHNLNYYLTLLDLPDDTDWVKDTIKIPQGNFLRAFLGSKYNNLQVLTETLERTEAIDIYKRYITLFSAYLQQGKEDRFNDLHEFWLEKTKPAERADGIKIISNVENGKVIYRKETCSWIEAIKEFPDSELKYYVACYGDFQGAKSLNRHFILTMKHTIAEGDPYCSCIMHDTRVDWDLTHPSEEFWDNIWPLKEWQKK